MPTDDTLAKTHHLRQKLQSLLNDREDVLDHSLTPIHDHVEGIIDVDPDHASNVDAHAEQLQTDLPITVTDAGIPTDPKHPSPPLPGLTADRYDTTVYRYEITATPE